MSEKEKYKKVYEETLKEYETKKKELLSGKKIVKENKIREMSIKDPRFIKSIKTISGNLPAIIFYGDNVKQYPCNKYNYKTTFELCKKEKIIWTPFNNYTEISDPLKITSGSLSEDWKRYLVEFLPFLNFKDKTIVMEDKISYSIDTGVKSYKRLSELDGANSYKNKNEP